MVDANKDQGGAAPQAGQAGSPNAQPGEAEKQTAELKVQLAGKDRTLTDFQEGRRMPKWMEEQGWTMKDGRPVPPEALFGSPPASGSPGAGGVKLDYGDEGRPLPPDPDNPKYINPETGEVDKSALRRDQVVYEDALWSFRRGIETEADRDDAVREAVKTLPESLRSTEEDAALCEDLIAVYAERIAGGRTPTRKDVVEATSRTRAVLERQAKALLAETDATAKANAKREPTHLTDLPAGRAPEDTGPPLDPYSPAAQQKILDQRAAR